MEGAKRRRGKKRHSYGPYLKRMVPLLNCPEMKISTDSVQVLDSMMDDIFDRIAKQAAHFADSCNKKTLTPRNIEFATKLIIPGELGTNAVKSGQAAIRRVLLSEEDQQSEFVELISYICYC